MRNILVNYFAPLESRADKGQILENYVYLRLARRYQSDKIKYWRTADGQEVDFIAEESAFSGRAVEVKFSKAGFKAGKYARFRETYPEYPLEVWFWGEHALLM
ncbi:MAG: DUF4143 domain-containing protein [Bacteroidota bacterium]